MQFKYQVVFHEYRIASFYKGFILLQLQQHEPIPVEMEFQFTTAGQSPALERREGNKSYS